MFVANVMASYLPIIITDCTVHRWTPEAICSLFTHSQTGSFGKV
jgi:hypothetical protein